LIGRLRPTNPKLEVVVEYAEGELRKPSGTIWYASDMSWLK
jgi:hypothetical protein